MEILEKPYLPPRPPRFKFTYGQEPSKEVLSIDGLNLEIGGKSLIVGGQLHISRGQKVAIVGDNGAGKSTLLRAITAKENPAVTLGRYVVFSYYDQEMANLDMNETVLGELWGRHVAYSQTEVRASLARCGLFPEDMDKKVGSLSGGERAKLALCVFENAHGNVLVLDEPTNHLDLPARESLEEALKAFEGTVIFVSHDRYFISAVADRVAEIGDKKLSVYEGGYEGYKQSKAAAAEAAKRAEEEARRQEYEAARADSYRNKKERAREAQLRAELKAVEKEIGEAEALESELNARLADPQTASNYERMKEILKSLEETRKKLDALYERYGEIIG